MNKEVKHKEIIDLIIKGDYAFRSCWNCNSAHERLKNCDYLISCIWCSGWFYKGKKIKFTKQDIEYFNLNRKVGEPND